MSKAAYRKDRILFAFVFVFAYGPTRRIHGDEEGWRECLKQKTMRSHFQLKQRENKLDVG